MFTSSGTFAVPKRVKSVRVLLVGGGGSGDNGDQGRGGGGYVVCGNVAVSNVTNVSVTVGAGGLIGPSAGVFHSRYYFNLINTIHVVIQFQFYVISC